MVTGVAISNNRNQILDLKKAAYSIKKEVCHDFIRSRIFLLIHYDNELHEPYTKDKIATVKRFFIAVVVGNTAICFFLSFFFFWWGTDSKTEFGNEWVSVLIAEKIYSPLNFKSYSSGGDGDDVGCAWFKCSCCRVFARRSSFIHIFFNYFFLKALILLFFFLSVSCWTEAPNAFGYRC